MVLDLVLEGCLKGLKTLDLSGLWPIRCWVSKVWLCDEGPRGRKAEGPGGAQHEGMWFR